MNGEEVGGGGEEVDLNGGDGGGGGQNSEDIRLARAMRNRKAAMRSRQQTKAKKLQLEDENKLLADRIGELEAEQEELQKRYAEKYGQRKGF